MRYEIKLFSVNIHAKLEYKELVISIIKEFGFNPQKSDNPDFIFYTFNDTTFAKGIILCRVLFFYLENDSYLEAYEDDIKILKYELNDENLLLKLILLRKDYEYI